MCGIFAYTGTGTPDPDLLVRAASGAGQRGPHGHGWATHGPDGVETHHRLGPIFDATDAVKRLARDVHRVVGHARLATIGRYDHANELQPIALDGHALAHNGNVYNPTEVDPDHDGPSDSFALARLYARLRAQGEPPARVIEAVVQRASQRAWAVCVLDADGTLVAHRKYHPLYAYRDDRGTYLSSRPMHRTARLIPEGKPVVV